MTQLKIGGTLICQFMKNGTLDRGQIQVLGLG